MADLQKVVHGELNWDPKVNKIIEYLNSDGAIDKLTTSREGIVFTNFNTYPIGSSNDSGYTKYQLMKVGTETWVHLHIEGSIANDPGGSHAVNIMNIPVSVAPGNIKHEAYPLGENPSNGIAIVEVSNGGTVNVVFPTSFTPGAGTGVWADLYYLAKE